MLEGVLTELLIKLIEWVGGLTVSVLISKHHTHTSTRRINKRRRMDCFRPSCEDPSHLFALFILA